MWQFKFKYVKISMDIHIHGNPAYTSFTRQQSDCLVRRLSTNEWSLCGVVRSRRLPTIITSSLHGMCRKSILHGISVTFSYISQKPHFDLEPEYISRKLIKRRFQQYLVRTEIMSTFHARVEYSVLDAQTQNGDEPVGEYSFSGQSCLSSADSWWYG